MALTRKPFQGVLNIIRFNWHFYLVAGLVLFCLLFFKKDLPQQIRFFVFVLSITAILAILISLSVSLYVYDFSGLYKLNWFPNADYKKILSLNAGFDETSEIINAKFPNSDVTVCDFYTPEKHTEISIKRARKAYPPFAGTIQISTDRLPFQSHSFDFIFVILSAHEIRDKKERIIFFTELNRVLKPTGQIFVTEHLRDISNFMAYTIGFLHFYSKADWLKTFAQANLKVKNEIKTTPFITTFILDKNGYTL